ncbi:YeeE/YedE family integral membrane protein [Lentithecium fluviatile CBS 122367]|uniref:YeeE/YedE family integral membrane protein n=1 Tax=Lentithecium fluviatile CBS 122367 TaxID=1168545 RepID=A0A6G1JG03_9PLEO|nr:YeeE/YedE family integral membrane protein [Lentithecium fluviatile CBS 122367]
MFTPIQTTFGALLLHQATSLLLYGNGNILGASGLIRRLFTSPTKGTVAFFAGMAASFVPLALWIPEAMTKYPTAPVALGQALATVGCGLLVGWGTKAANGCTTGHMLCGLSRLSGRSAIAVATFFPAAILTHHLVHPSLLTDVCSGDVPCYLPVYPSRETTTSLAILTVTTILAARTLPHLVAKWTKTEDIKCDPNVPARIATQFFAGLELGLGLHITQMSHPAKVASFLSMPNWEVWDPSMALVMVFGVLPSLIENQIKGFSAPPCFNEKFELPQKTVRDIDWKFVVGAAVFGVGWGLSGTCPGPAILRSFAQPAWGFLWMGGFWAGAQMLREGC